MHVANASSSNQEQIQDTELVKNECLKCYVKKTAKEEDKKECVKCYDHLRCYPCIIEWYHQMLIEHRIPRCKHCQRKIVSELPSFVLKTHCCQKRKNEFIEFTRKNRAKTSEWFGRLILEGVHPEYCPFECGFAEVCEDGVLMCPHGLYKMEAYEEEQKKKKIKKKSSNRLGYCVKKLFKGIGYLVLFFVLLCFLPFWLPSYCIYSVCSRLRR